VRLTVRALTIAIAAVLAGAAPAHAAGWLSSEPLAAAGTAPALTVAANGTAVAVWVGADGLRAARHAPGVPGFAALPAFGAAGATEPQVGIDDAGNATAAWMEGATLQTASLPADAARQLGDFEKNFWGGVRWFAEKKIVWIDESLAAAERLREEWRARCAHTPGPEPITQTPPPEGVG